MSQMARQRAGGKWRRGGATGRFGVVPWSPLGTVNEVEYSALVEF